MSYLLLQGDNRDVLREWGDNVVDAVVTDPPYGIRFMGKAWDGKDIERTVRWKAGGNEQAATRNGSAQSAGLYDVSLKGLRAFQVWCEEWGREALRVLKPGGYLLACGSPRAYHRLAAGLEDAGFEVRDSLHWLYGSGFPKSLNGEWGGTALKPAHEPIIVARKPFATTVAENFATFGTGALNIDGCRVGTADKLVRPPILRDDNAVLGTGLGVGRQDEPDGRWPPNVLLDPEAAAALDRQAPRTGAAAQVKTSVPGGARFGGNGIYNPAKGITEDAPFYADEGGASRFFPVHGYTDEDFWPFQYVAKAARSEREAGCSALPARSGAEAVDREEGSAGTKSPRAGAGRTAKEVRNSHPTVKHIALMRWLVRLVTPPGGLVLDPFAGSGTTGVAALYEGFDFVGIEREADYVAIAEARLEHHARKAS